jgi:4'-phosphopantetheinyl transferase
MSVVNVWYVRVDAASGAAALDLAPRLLSAAEEGRSAKFAFERDRRAYRAAHALLRLALSRKAGVPPETWRFRTEAGGRPEIAGSEQRFGLRFSLSHTAGLAVCAVTAGSAIGVDAEGFGPRTPLEVATRHFAERERGDVAALPAERQPERFTEYWTLKEAFLKATGLGITYPLDRISFTLAGKAGVEVALPADLGEAPIAWQFESWGLHRRWRVALAVRTAGGPLFVRFAEFPVRSAPCVEGIAAKRRQSTGAKGVRA